MAVKAPIFVATSASSSPPGTTSPPLLPPLLHQSGGAGASSTPPPTLISPMRSPDVTLKHFYMHKHLPFSHTVPWLRNACMLLLFIHIANYIFSRVSRSVSFEIPGNISLTINVEVIADPDTQWIPTRVCKISYWAATKLLLGGNQNQSKPKPKPSRLCSHLAMFSVQTRRSTANCN